MWNLSLYKQLNVVSLSIRAISLKEAISAYTFVIIAELPSKYTPNHDTYGTCAIDNSGTTCLGLLRIYASGKVGINTFGTKISAGKSIYGDVTYIIRS